ncbi:MAG TPA: heparinase II/III family protein [Bryobacteraceae bacterium]|nr:heparinase II/III family protein [Bryobacteraceae bacterium]
MAILLLPVRLPAYKLRKRAFRRRALNARNGQRVASSAIVVDSKVHSPFISRLPSIQTAEDRERVCAEADAQLCGRWRLAGGRIVPLDFTMLDGLKDYEDRHAYHRLRWAVCYSRAAAYGHSGARQALDSQLHRWLAKDWSADPAFGWPYTTAERIATLSECLVWSPTLPVAACKKQIASDARRLSSNVEYGLGLHNHLLNNARGLYIAAAAVPECAEASGWREQAFSIWEEAFPRLVLEDGVFAEQSSHYHVLLCRTALEYWLAAKASRRDVAPVFRDRLKRMFNVANDLIRPDGSLARFGDNSPDGAAADCWGLMTAAWFHGLLDQPPRHAAVTALTLYYCGLKPELPAGQAEEGVRLYRHGGFAILRKGDCELIAHGEPRAVNATHGDAGRGSFELWRRGTVLIRQPGSCWSSDVTARRHRSGHAQNVTCLNGLAPGMTAEDRAYLPRWYSVQDGSWEKIEGNGVRFRCNGFQRIRPNIICTRSWRFQEQSDVLFEEHIEGGGSVRFESHLCLGDAAWGSLTWDRAAGRGQLSHELAEMIIETVPGMCASIEPFRFLQEYGLERDGQRLSLSAQVKLPFAWRIQWSFKGVNT